MKLIKALKTDKGEEVEVYNVQQIKVECSENEMEKMEEIPSKLLQLTTLEWEQNL